MTDIVKATPTGAIATARKRPGEVYLRRYSNPISRKTMRASLLAVMRAAGVDTKIVTPEDFPWEQVTFEVATEIRAKLVETYKPRSAAHHVVALAGVMKVCARLGLVSRELLLDLTERGGPLAAVKGDTPLAGRMLSPAEVVKSIETVSAGRLKRDAAVLALAAYCGLRRAEIASLTTASFEGDALKVVGKGNKTRIVPIPAGARARLDAYLAERGRAPGPLFYRSRRGAGGPRNGRLVPSEAGIRPHSVWRIVRDACDAAAFEVKATPHDFRRTFASLLIDAGVDIVTVRDLMGHDSIETTIRYDRRGEERKKRAASVLDSIFEPR